MAYNQEKVNTTAENSIEPSNGNQTDANQPFKARKRSKDPTKWKSFQRKLKCQSGQEYTSSRGKIVAAKGTKTTKDCIGNCKYLCATKVTENERQLQFKGFRTLNQTRQQDFLLRSTERNLKNRSTSGSTVSRRAFTFVYFLNLGTRRVEVCKQFYLDTFDISDTRVYNAHKKKCLLTGMASEDMRGKTPSLKISIAKEKEVIDHINSFPRVESHYCRAKTKRKYLESNLNITKMYDLYKVQTDEPIKESYYRHIFCTKFNLGFLVPKSDRCGKCEKFKVAKRNGLTTQHMSDANDKHVKLKEDMRKQKSIDLNGTVPVLSFDLENVLNCPRAEIGPMFYYSKLNVYNLTAQLTIQSLDESTMDFTRVSSTYCAMWTEYTSGRTGNDLASAVVKILNRVFEENPHMKNLITWSDSCVPQNRNSIISSAILHFLQNHPAVNSVTMKYSVDGHGAVQEVDNIHSSIEKVLGVNEYFSPIGLVTLLKTVNRKNPMNIMEMTSSDFRDYKEYGIHHYNFSKIPFTKVRVIKFSQSLDIEYSDGYDESLFIKISVRLLKGKPNQPNDSSFSLNLISKPPELSDLKKLHLILMFEYMSPTDINYYENVCKLNISQLAKLKRTKQGKSAALKMKAPIPSEIIDSDHKNAELNLSSTRRKSSLTGKIHNKKQTESTLSKQKATTSIKLRATNAAEQEETKPIEKKTRTRQPKSRPKSTELKIKACISSEITDSDHKNTKLNPSCTEPNLDAEIQTKKQTDSTPPEATTSIKMRTSDAAEQQETKPIEKKSRTRQPKSTELKIKACISFEITDSDHKNTKLNPSCRKPNLYAEIQSKKQTDSTQPKATTAIKKRTTDVAQQEDTKSSRKKTRTLKLNATISSEITDFDSKKNNLSPSSEADDSMHKKTRASKKKYSHR